MWRQYKIRELHKERTKARLHPTREQGPSKKKRKINESEYININEIWDKARMSATQKSEQEPEEYTTRKKWDERIKQCRKEIEEEEAKREQM